MPQTRPEAPVALDDLCRRRSEAATDRTLYFPFDRKLDELASLIRFEQVQRDVREDLGARDFVSGRDLGPTSYITSRELQVEGRADVSQFRKARSYRKLRLGLAVLDAPPLRRDVFRE